jgi:hypothetical protein
MASRPPVRLREAIVDPRRMVREYLVLAAVAAVCLWVAIDAPNVFSIAVAGVGFAFVSVTAVAATPGSTSLTVDDVGLTIGVFYLFRRRIPWADIGAIEVAEGWQGETVALEVGGEIGSRTIFGLPVDPGLGRRAFVTTFGLEPADLCALLRDRRAAAGG